MPRALMSPSLRAMMLMEKSSKAKKKDSNFLGGPVSGELPPSKRWKPWYFEWLFGSLQALLAYSNHWTIGLRRQSWAPKWMRDCDSTPDDSIGNVKRTMGAMGANPPTCSKRMLGKCDWFWGVCCQSLESPPHRTTGTKYHESLPKVDKCG